MHCERCGYELEEDAAFCQQCGAPATPEDDPSASETEPSAVSTTAFEPAAPMAPAAEEPRFSSKQIACMVVAGAAVVGAILCIALFCMDPPDVAVPDDAPSSSTATSANAPSGSEATNEEDESGATNAETDSASTGADAQGAVSQASATGQILPDSDSRYYTRAELEALSDRELYLARNEIYARLGRGFKNQDLVDWFSGQDWYVERYPPSEFDALPDQRNEYEHANSDLMMEIETERGSQYL